MRISALNDRLRLDAACVVGLAPWWNRGLEVVVSETFGRAVIIDRTLYCPRWWLDEASELIDRYHDPVAETRLRRTELARWADDGGA